AITLGVASFRSGSLLGEGLEKWFGPATWVVLGLSIGVMVVAVWMTGQMTAADGVMFPPVLARPHHFAVPVPDLWGFAWAPIALFGAAAVLVALFSVIQVCRWFVWREINLDQFAVVLMLVFIVFWQYAYVVAGIAVLTVIAVHLPVNVLKWIARRVGLSTD